MALQNNYNCVHKDKQFDIEALTRQLFRRRPHIKNGVEMETIEPVVVAAAVKRGRPKKIKRGRPVGSKDTKQRKRSGYFARWEKVKQPT